MKWLKTINTFNVTINSPQHRKGSTSFYLHQLIWEADQLMLTNHEVDPQEGQHQTPPRLTGSHRLSAQPKSAIPREAELNPILHPPSKPSLLIFTVSERKKAASHYGKNVSIGQRLSVSVTPPGAVGHSHIIYGVEEHHPTSPNTIQNSNPVRIWTQRPICHLLRCFTEPCDESSCTDTIKTSKIKPLSCWALIGVPAQLQYTTVSAGGSLSVLPSVADTSLVLLFYLLSLSF